MYRIEREAIILERLKAGDVVKLTDLAELTRASDVTIRRDLSRLEARGLVERSHGCARLAGREGTAAHDRAHAEKEVVARIAATLVQDGDHIFLGAGTTCTLLARHLHSEKKHLMVMTTNLDAVTELTRAKSTNRVSILGGEVQVETNYVETLDEYTLAVLQRLYFDKVFITVNGIDFDHGHSILKQQQLPLYHHLMAQSAAFYVIADSRKFGRRAFVHLCDIDAVRHIVTVRRMRDRHRQAFERHGIEAITDEKNGANE